MSNQTASAQYSDWRVRNRVRCVVFRGVLLLALANSVAGATELKLGSVSLPGKGEVRFETRYSQPVDQPGCEVEGKNVETYSYPDYFICIDLDDIEVTKYGSALRYHFYVTRGVRMTAGAIHFVVDGEAVGAYLPHMAEVDLFVGEDLANAVPKRIHLPIFSPESPPYLGVASLDLPIKVNFAASTDVAVSLKNQIPWPVTVTGIRPATGKLGGLWGESGVAILVNGSQVFHSFDLEPSAECHDVVALRLKPNPGMAFLEAFFTGNSGKEHDTVSLTLEHRTRWGGSRSVDVRLPIQFVPWPPLLFLAVGIGAVIGSLAAWLFGWRRHSTLMNSMGTALLSGVIMELIAMFLVQLNSEVRVFGFRFDPFQLLPALVIGILIGLSGRGPLDLFERILGRFQGHRSPPRETEAQHG